MFPQWSQGSVGIIHRYGGFESCFIALLADIEARQNCGTNRQIDDLLRTRQHHDWRATTTVVLEEERAPSTTKPVDNQHQRRFIQANWSRRHSLDSFQRRPHQQCNVFPSQVIRPSKTDKTAQDVRQEKGSAFNALTLKSANKSKTGWYNPARLY